MDAQQFQQLTAGLAQQEADRRRVQAQREHIKDLIKQTTTCDGSTTAAVRTWVKEINLAHRQVGDNNIVQVVSKSVTGPLRFEIERYLIETTTARNIVREAVPWDDIRDHIQHQFLNVDEAAALRDEVEQTKQSAYEPEAQYSRRFRDVADAAYPANQRNADQERILVRAYARGLCSHELARKLVEEENPNNLEAAIRAVSTFSERKDAFSRLGRKEEPMEVSPVNAQKSQSPPTSTDSAITSLTVTMQKLATKVAKLEAAQHHPPKQPVTRTGPPTAPPRPPNRDAQGRPRCYECQKYGHIGRDCSVRRQRLARSGNGQRS